MAVQMELARILIRELADYQIIELREILPAPETPLDEAAQFDRLQSARKFPIVIGLPEAQAIERRLKNIPVKRPQTHDLLANVITALGGTLESICITDLDDHTFFASLNVARSDGNPVAIDARPSDAIALGIAQQVPIYVEEHVLEGALKEES
ncbi:MAG: bifunctional nuclease family protein [Phycisphaeraceae bacterium]|nr:bifunctional nuclease family protein [Phycisphaeraceae bacterium]MCW5761855.1 bifunctional nuclease family protein [Phycisphaeraceae bacterium]